MNIQELIRSLQTEVARLRRQGHDAISLAALNQYYQQLEQLAAGEPNQLDQVAIEQMRAALEIQLANFERAGNQEREMFRSVVTAGHSALQASMLINGGAAVAILAFIGHVVTDQQARALVPSAALPLFLFVVALLCVVIASGSTYLAQRFRHLGKIIWGHVFNSTAIALVIISYILFAVASKYAYNVLEAFKP